VETAPRYQPLRTLPATPYVPGRGPRPREDAVDSRDPRRAAEYVSARRWAEHDEYLWGVDLYNAGFFWEAHEAWEAAWHAAASDRLQHEFVQALIQCAAACLKGVMGDVVAARRLAARASQRLESVRAEVGASYMGLELAGFAMALRRFAHEDSTALPRRPSIVLDASTL
jgi:uncharacterized protein